MPSFQKLLAGAAAKIAKRQAELDALRDPAVVEAERLAAERAALEAAARGHFGATWPEGQGLRLKHGSPHKYERFDFENNLRKGEGALAFGPGGYMTGNDALARQYARELFARYADKDETSHHATIKKAIGMQPQAMAEFLRARNVAIGLASGLDANTQSGGVRTLTRLPPHLLPKGIEPQGKIYGGPNGWEPEYAFYTQGTARDFAPYREAMAEVGIKGSVLEQLKRTGRVGRGGLAPSDAARIGDKLRNVIEKNYGGPGLRPMVSERMRLMPQSDYDSLLRYQYDQSNGRSANRGLSPYYAELPPGAYYGPGALRNIDSALRLNLNSTWRAANNKPGNKTVKLSMSGGAGGGGYVDFNKAELYRALAEGRLEPQEFARRLYEADFAAHPDEMLPHDYPISTAGPKVLGALAQIQRSVPGMSPLNPEMTGSTFMAELRSKAGLAGMSSLDQMRLFRDAGIPALYFLRGGRRSIASNAPPERFVPDDYNFVIFDQNRLGKPDVEEFARGGQVQ